MPGNIVVKANADKGNTVLFRTGNAGGTLQISIDGVNWFTVGGDSSAIAISPYDFLSPLAVSGTDVYVKAAVSDTVAPGEEYKAVIVGGNTQKIGYNLLPDSIRAVRDMLDESGVIMRNSLPADLVYTVEGVVSESVIPANVAKWDESKVIAKENLPSTVVYLVEGVIPAEAIPSEAFDTWEDLTK
jgi:hypothetical protein